MGHSLLRKPPWLHKPFSITGQQYDITKRLSSNLITTLQWLSWSVSHSSQIISLCVNPFPKITCRAQLHCLHAADITGNTADIVHDRTMRPVTTWSDIKPMILISISNKKQHKSYFLRECKALGGLWSRVTTSQGGVNQERNSPINHLIR